MIALILAAAGLVATLILACLLLIACQDIADLRSHRDALQRSLASEKRRADALAIENAELLCQMDDATRLMQQASVSIGHHVREHVTLAAQVEALTTRNTYAEACLRHRNAVMAGILLVGQVQPVGVDVP